MRSGTIVIVAGLSLLLPGCLAAKVTKIAVGEAAKQATAPVRSVFRTVDTANTVVDKLTTSDAERDQKRGREMRKRDERLGKLSRTYDKQSRDCARGKEKACRERYKTYAEIRRLMPSYY